MTEKLKQIVKEEIEKLPAESREAISSLDWVAISEEIGSKYFPDEAGLNDFQTEILVVLLGLEGPELFQIHMENNLGATSEEAPVITGEVFERIFAPISSEIKENIKKSGKVYDADWRKNLDFILSGGDFSVFLDQPRDENKV